MLSNKPYLVRAFYDWIVDSSCTPHVVLNATHPRCKVPQEFIQNGEIVFNISPNAVRELKIGNETVEFCASFSGIVRIISAPIKAVLAIYAEENGQGMFFDYEEEDGDLAGSESVVDASGFSQAQLSDAPTKPADGKRPFLKLVD